MSGKNKWNYKKVCKKAVKNLHPSHVLQTVTIDFEAAVWKAIPCVFHGVAIL